MNFGIGIPTLNRYDILEKNLRKYKNDFPNTDIHIIDNGLQGIPSSERVHVTSCKSNIGVAASWNRLCKKIFEKHDYALIVNDDVYLGYGEDVVEDVISREYGISVSVVSWSVFLIHRKMYEYIGEFDETFYPAYYEDSDYLYRMKLYGQMPAIVKDLTPKEVIISGTYEKNKELVNNAMAANRERYINKWGGLPLMEQFINPYNKQF